MGDNILEGSYITPISTYIAHIDRIVVTVYPGFFTFVAFHNFK